MNGAEPHALYRFYSTSGQLLYVGITNNPANRFEQHRDSKEWWSEVSGITIEWHPDRAAVLAAERTAVQNEMPLYNIHLQKSSHRRPKPTPRTRGIVWFCDECRTPVADREGWIHCVEAERFSYAQGIRERKSAASAIPAQRQSSWVHVSASEILGRPSPARWWIHHRECDPDIDSVDYCIDIERIRTPLQVIHWTAHLMGKRWLRDTAWDELLESVSSHIDP